MFVSFDIVEYVMQLIYGIIWSEFSWENQDLVEKQEHKWLVNWKEWQSSNYYFNWNIAKLYFIYYVICTTPDLLLLLKLLSKSIYSSLPISGLFPLAFCGLSTRESFVHNH